MKIKTPLKKMSVLKHDAIYNESHFLFFYIEFIYNLIYVKYKHVSEKNCLSYFTFFLIKSKATRYTTSDIVQISKDEGIFKV